MFELGAANQTPFFWTVTPPVFFLGKENGGVLLPPAGGIFLRTCVELSPLEFEQFHNCLFMFPHLRFHRPFVQMVVAQKVKHRVRHEVRQLAAVMRRLHQISGVMKVDRPAG